MQTSNAGLLNSAVRSRMGQAVAQGSMPPQTGTVVPSIGLGQTYTGTPAPVPEDPTTAALRAGVQAAQIPQKPTLRYSQMNNPGSAALDKQARDFVHLKANLDPSVNNAVLDEGIRQRATPDTGVRPGAVPVMNAVQQARMGIGGTPMSQANGPPPSGAVMAGYMNTARNPQRTQ